ncbi:hypothetical protein HPB50_011832 [Hyalomma asiaticum]|uniref:Uncharacterized protein n=1 Tax=Hyalomma asiaticum TaxID=266040 RepID=A0ACB7SEE6_HYAAI|nr:hypothetical protein HPB50_011832 [Hyalomma asiaticum]
MIVKTLSSRSVSPCAAPVIEQPFSSLEELLAFDEKLDKEASNTLVNEFVQLGGSDGNWATKRILAYCMTDEVAAQFSWMGRKGKRSFSALKIAKVVKVAASKAPNSTPVIIEAAVKSWLRHAPERLVSKPQKQRSGSEVHQTAGHFERSEIRIGLIDRRTPEPRTVEPVVVQLLPDHASLERLLGEEHNGKKVKAPRKEKKFYMHSV